MFTKNKDGDSSWRDTPRRGRPPGETAQGLAMRARLYRIATQLFAQRGFEETTLRDIARRAGVSPALLYRYFPSKRAVVLALYDDLSRDFERAALGMPSGKWRDRFLFAVRASLGALGPHRDSLVALIPLLVGRGEEGLFAPATAFSRERVQAVFAAAVTGATDAPRAADATAVGHLLYLAHLGVLLWWLLDRSPKQRATDRLLAIAARLLAPLALALRLGPMRALMRELDDAANGALFGDRPSLA
jgi:AcrR family transcriptional regulator